MKAISHLALLAAVVIIHVGAAAADVLHACGRIPDHARLDLTSCQYAQRYCQANLIDYYSLYYCSSPSLAILAICIVSIAVMSLLSSTANQFLIPTLQHISSSLDLSPSVAGVTLLAFGNSAPDIFTSLAGMKSDDVALVLSALVGAGVCTTALCLGLVIVIAKPKIDNPVWFLRDLFSYLIATALIILVCVAGEISLWHGIAFVSLYVLYAGSVVFSVAYDSSPKKVISVDSDAISSSLLISDAKDVDPDDGRFRLYDFGPDPKHAFGPKKEPSWPAATNSALSDLQKLRQIAEYPFTLLRMVTVPKLGGDFTEDERNRLVFATTAVPILCFFAFFEGSLRTIPAWMLLGCPLASVAAYRYLPQTRRPSCTMILALIGFISSIAWISIFASEMVAIVQAIGMFCNVNSAVLGLTVLAMASTFGDLTTNVSVACHGGGASAVSACFGAPILNDLLGLGIALCLACLQSYPTPIRFAIDPNVTLGWSFLITTLVVNLLGFALTKFQPDRSFGLLLVVLYGAFIAASLFVI